MMSYLIDMGDNERTRKIVEKTGLNMEIKNWFNFEGCMTANMIFNNMTREEVMEHISSLYDMLE